MASGETVAFLLGNWIFLVRYWIFNFSIARGKCVEMMPVLRMNNRDYHPINKDHNEVSKVLWFTALHATRHDGLQLDFEQPFVATDRIAGYH